MTVERSLYTFDGSFYIRGPLTVGPWSPDALHGGPVSALLSGAVEDPSHLSQVVRVTIELMRPVPLTPLRLTSEVVRPGRNVQLVEASLWSDSLEVARARALRIRRAEVEVPVDHDLPYLPPDDGSAAAPDRDRTAFPAAVDLRFVKGSWEELGPVTMWSRLLVPVVEGQPVSQLQRVAAVADFGNGVSRVVDFQTHVFINPDLTVALARVPQGEWILFDAVSRLSTEGFGQAESQIFDAVGPVGRSIQSLLVTPR